MFPPDKSIFFTKRRQKKIELVAGPDRRRCRLRAAGLQLERFEAEPPPGGT